MTLQIVHGITMKTTSAEHILPMFYPFSALVVFMVIPWIRHSMNNLLSYCVLVEVRIGASEKDLPVLYFDALL